MTKTIPALVFLMLAFSAASFSQVSQATKTIPIAIPDAMPYGESTSAGSNSKLIDLYTNWIMTEVSSIPYFQVLERKQANELSQEVAYQLRTGGELTDAVSNINLRGAMALLLTGFGELYGKIVITARFVDLQSGRVLFASTTYSKPEDVQSAIKDLTASIREKGGELGLVVKLPDVQRAVKARSWKEAQRLADIYIRQNPGDGAIRAIYGTIAVKRAVELYKQARKSVGLRLFKEARISIDEAIALVPEGAYYAFRDSISGAEIDDQYRQKALAARREEKFRTGSTTLSPLDDLREYLKNISSEELRIGASYSPLLSTPNLRIDPRDGDWGIELGWTNSIKPPDGRSLISWVWYAGTEIRYERIREGGMGIFAAAWLSPLLAQSIRLGPLVITLGLDTGAFFNYGPFPDNDNRYGVTVGADSEIAFRLGPRWGAFGSAKADWRIYPSDQGRSGPAFRLVAGLNL